MGRHRPRAGGLRRRGLPRRRPRGARHRREPAHRDALADPGQPRLRRGPRLHAVLRDELHLHRACGRGRLPCRACSTSAARARRRSAASAPRSSVLNLALPAGLPAGARSASSAPPPFGAAWAAVPGYLQAKRGSHIVITTIMFNWLASVLIVYLLVNVLREPTSMNPETRAFPPQSRRSPSCTRRSRAFGIDDPALAAQPHLPARARGRLSRSGS